MSGALCTRTNDEGEISHVFTYAAKELGPFFPIQVLHNIIDPIWVLYTKELRIRAYETWNHDTRWRSAFFELQYQQQTLAASSKNAHKTIAMDFHNLKTRANSLYRNIYVHN